MRLRNEINKIGLNINQIVNNNSHIYDKDDKVRLTIQMSKLNDLLTKYISVVIDMYGAWNVV